MHGGRAVMLDGAPARPGESARRSSRARWLGPLLAVALAAGAPWAFPSLATRLAAVADAITPAGTTSVPLVPAGQQVAAVPVPETWVQPERHRAGAPRELILPRLGLVAPVDPVSGRGGELTPPADPSRVGWWKEGARPGGAGAVVLIGHTVSTGGGVFDHLERVRPGDAVRVRTVDGWTTYVVDRTRTYSVAELARSAPAVFSRSGPGRLVLVTCTGFDGEVFRSRTVVVAVPMSRPGGRR